MAGIAPSYRIGPSDFFTPGDLQADSRTLNDAVNRLDDSDWTKPSQALFDAWTSFIPEWRGFYTGNFLGWTDAFLASLNDSTRDQLIQFETRFLDFVAQYQQQTGIALPDVVQPSTGAKDTLADHLKNQLGPLVPSLDSGKLLLVVGLVVAGVVVYFFRAPLGRALSKGAA
jgi:hypothetical protein